MLNELSILVIALTISLGIIVCAFLGKRIVSHYSRVEVVLKKWAEENSCEILDGEIRWIRKGPFLLSANGQTVYHVKVRDRDGHIRTGWVRCAGWFIDEWPGKVETAWD